MAAFKLSSALRAWCARQAIEPKRAQHRAALAETLFSRTRHLHGLTKTALRWVRLTTVLRTASPDAVTEKASAKFFAALKPPLNAVSRRLVLRAAELAEHARPPASPPSQAGKHAAFEAIALRIAALVRIAEGLDHVPRPGTRIVGVADDGQAVDIRLATTPAAKENAVWGLKRSELFNTVALRPIRAFTLSRHKDEAWPLVAPTQPAAEAGRRVLQRHLEHLLARQYGLANREDLEYVHEMRVATRRLRAALPIFRKYFSDRLERPAEELRKLADQFGPARDADVFLAFLNGYRKKAGPGVDEFTSEVIAWEQKVRDKQYRQLGKLLRDAQTQEFLRGWYGQLRRTCGETGGLEPTGKGCARPAWKLARKSLRTGWDRLQAFGRQLDGLSSEQQHDLRIACKKLRYAAEFFSDFYPPELKSWIARFTEMQDLLGESHDCVVYIQRLEGYVRKRFGKRPGAKIGRAARVLRRHLLRRKRRSLQKAARLWQRITAPKATEAWESLAAHPLQE